MNLDLQILTLSGSILLASFLGSWHCAAMCGPVATLMATKNRLIPYHLGRLISYLTLGAIAGGIGNIFISSEFKSLRLISVTLFSLLLFTMGLKLFWPDFSKASFWRYGFFKFIQRLIFRLQAFSINKPPFLIGLLTALLPCGWLYSYVFAAIATQSTHGGALVMFVFWFGGLPALLTLPTMIKQTIARSSGREKKIAGIILIIASIYSALSFFIH